MAGQACAKDEVPCLGASQKGVCPYNGLRRIKKSSNEPVKMCRNCRSPSYAQKRQKVTHKPTQDACVSSRAPTGVVQISEMATQLSPIFVPSTYMKSIIKFGRVHKSMDLVQFATECEDGKAIDMRRDGIYLTEPEAQTRYKKGMTEFMRALFNGRVGKPTDAIKFFKHTPEAEQEGSSSETCLPTLIGYTYTEGK